MLVFNKLVILNAEFMQYTSLKMILLLKVMKVKSHLTIWNFKEYYDLLFKYL